jgi:hypothetical protein
MKEKRENNLRGREIKEYVRTVFARRMLAPNPEPINFPGAKAARLESVAVP